MRPLLYWTAATILVVVLLLVVFLVADLISTSRWPFHQIWGGVMVALGLLFVVLGGRFPAALWRIRKTPAEPDPRLLAHAKSIPMAFGASIAFGGVVYSLTARVDALIACFVLGVAFVRLGLGRRGTS